ncbi:MAG: HD domain-containing phosphohydrolase [Candidatus Muiribacteriota bacterium]
MPKLFIKDVNENEYEYKLDAEKKSVVVSIGRVATNDIIFDDVKVSRNHARISGDNKGSFVIEDLESSNGIFINGRRVNMKLLEPDDEIRIGDNFIKFKNESELNKVIGEIQSLRDNIGKITDVDGKELNISSKLNSVLSNMMKFADFVVKKEPSHKDISLQLKKYAKYIFDIKKQYMTIEKEYSSLFFLNKISKAIGNIVETRDFFTYSLDIILALLGAQRGFIMFYDKEKDRFEVKIARKMDEEIKNVESFSHNIVKHVFDTGEIYLSNSPENDPNINAGKSVVNYNIKAVMSAPLKYKGENIGVIYIDKQLETSNFSEADKRFFETYSNYCALTYERVKLFSELEDSYLASIKVLANVLDAKDPYTHGHSERVMEYSVAIAYKMFLSEKDIKNIKFGALLHDIGKVGVDLTILNKPGRLTDEEYEIIKSHPFQGFEIIKPVKFLEDKFAAIKYHHERWDGKGYPDGLKGEEIPLEARIVAVADTFDAMTSTRSYRKALEKDIAIAEIEKNSGTQFDPRIVEAFMKVVNKENVTQVWNRGQEIQKQLEENVSC